MFPNHTLASAQFSVEAHTPKTFSKVLIPLVFTDSERRQGLAFTFEPSINSEVWLEGRLTLYSTSYLSILFDIRQPMLTLILPEAVVTISTKPDSFLI